MQINECKVPLFNCIDGRFVKTKQAGIKSPRSVLCRSEQMEKMIRTETDKLVMDWERKKHEYEGLIYVMFLCEFDKVIPLYIGKAESIGKGEKNLSANIKNLKSDLSKFARWGDNYAYHIGDLSAVVLAGHHIDKQSKKYIDWAKSIFVEHPTSIPRLLNDVYFWTMCWKRGTVGIWEDFGPTNLTFLEYLMIGVASSAFPDRLLNRDGQNRG